jgi:hypothetical protein
MEISKQFTLDSNAVLMQVIINIIDAVSKLPFPQDDPELNNAQVMAIKLLRHVVSARQLYDVAKVEHEGPAQIAFIDHSSVMVVTRAALETFLVWNYLYGKPADNETRFRFLTWRLGGLMDRQKHKVVHEASREVQASELVIVEQLQGEISAHPNFQPYTHKQKTKLLAGDWKIVSGSSSLAAMAGLHATYFENVYNMLCGHSHTSYISVIQVRDAQSLEHQEALARTSIAVLNVTLAHFVLQYPIRFPSTQAVIDADETGKATANRWAFTVEDMNRTYASASVRSDQP